ncbi:hypothetical protein KY362_06650 [Candidatus Woesearchaeota archaeon]|nr:hypothetical protein [Candidatus Woesearchaeota archaeon]
MPLTPRGAAAGLTLIIASALATCNPNCEVEDCGRPDRVIAKADDHREYGFDGAVYAAAHTAAAGGAVGLAYLALTGAAYRRRRRGN